MDEALLLALLDAPLAAPLRACFPSHRTIIERPPFRNAGTLLCSPGVTIATVGRAHPAAELAWHTAFAQSTAVLLCRTGGAISLADAVTGQEGAPPIYPDILTEPAAPLASVVDPAAHQALFWLAQRLAPQRYGLLTMPAQGGGGQFYRVLRAVVSAIKEQL